MEDRTRRRDEMEGMMERRWAMNTRGTKGNKNNFHSIDCLSSRTNFRFIDFTKEELRLSVASLQLLLRVVDG